MSRIVGGIIAALGFLLALVATFNIHFGDPPAGQIIIGAIALVVVFVYTASLQENPNAQMIMRKNHSNMPIW